MASMLVRVGGKSKLLLSKLCRIVYTSTSLRQAGHLIPPTQYDIPISKKFHMFHALTSYWEIIPLFLTSLSSIGLVGYAIAWSVNNKMDVVYRTRSRDNISRTMDLRCPTIHKFITITQEYKPWPKLQDVLDDMKCAEENMKSCECNFK